ncbi:alpha-L-fucosidase [Puniceicoccaceae bacterium K14]|nr:alpha-L-fucosidase [Puniceicoccaceae bacterium K14]
MKYFLKPRIPSAIIALLLGGCAVLLGGCDEKTGAELPFPASHWILLDVEDAQQNSGSLEWSFELEKGGRYVLQVLSDGSSEGSVATIEVGGQELNGKLERDYVLESGIVSEFPKWVTFKEVGQQTLSLKAEASISHVRIVPHHSNPLNSGHFDEEWQMMHESPEKQAALKWFKEARFGMFIHWGLYSQAGGSWEGTRIEESPHAGPRVAEWLMSTFRIPREEYAEFAKTFNPDKSFAQNIARLAKDVGMKYVVITSKHHDGFALFDSASSEFDIVDATPYEGDAIKELYDACRAEGIEFGVYYSHGNDWMDGADGNYWTMKERHDLLGIHTHMQGKNHWDPRDNTHAEYLESKAYPQIKELLELMPDLRLIWFDGDGYITEEQAFRFYKLVYDINPNVILNRRVGFEFGDYLDAGDNVIPAASDNLSKHWETCGTTNNSWGFKSYDNDWKSPRELLYYFVDITSKGGNYLLNIGPDGAGNVPKQSSSNLRVMGEWVHTNADAIFGTTRWTIPHEGGREALLSGTGHRAAHGFSREFSNEDFWFTAKENKVYAMSLVAAESTVRIRALNKEAGIIKSVRLLGSELDVKWNQAEDALVIDSSDWNTSENGFAIEVVF